MPYERTNNLTHYYVGNSCSAWCPSHHMLTNTHKNKKGCFPCKNNSIQNWWRIKSAKVSYYMSIIASLLCVSFPITRNTNRIFSPIKLRETLYAYQCTYSSHLTYHRLTIILHFAQYSSHTWLSNGLIIVSSALKVFPNIWYESWITGGGLGARPLLRFSSVYWLIYCTGGSGNELTWAVSDAILLTLYILRTYSTIVKVKCLSLVSLSVFRPHSTRQ